MHGAGAGLLLEQVGHVCRTQGDLESRLVKICAGLQGALRPSRPLGLLNHTQANLKLLLVVILLLTLNLGDMTYLSA